MALPDASPDAWPTLLIIAGTFLLGGSVKGVIGIGLPAVAIGLLGAFMAPAQAAALIVVPSLVTNVWQAAGKGLGRLLARLWPMLAGICAGAWLGAGVLTGANTDKVRTALGLALFTYALIGLTKVKLHIPTYAELWLAAPVGVATGALAAATGIFVIPSGPYLQAIGLQKDDLVQAMGITFTVSTVVLGAVLAHGGALPLSLALPALLALAAALVGMVLGQLILARVPEQTFRTVFFIGLLLLGAHLALGAVL